MIRHNSLSYRLYMLTFMVSTLLLQGCIGSSQRRGPSTELSRVLSPDRRVEAVVVRNDGGGATIGYTYSVSIVPKGGSTEYEEDVITTKKTDSLSVKWLKNRWLEIHMAEGVILNFTNFWWSSKVDDWHYVVEIKLATPEHLFDAYKWFP